MARWLAPLAIVVIALVTLAVVSGAELDDEGGGSDRDGTTSVSEPDLDAEGNTTTRQPDSGEKDYVVKPGDTLSSIAVETGVDVEELQALNPDVDPQALVTGERLKLR